MTPRLKKFLRSVSRQTDQALRRYLPAPRTLPQKIHASMRYSVFAGGKRLRPALVIAAAEACGGRASRVLPTACALEMIHTYSLIHDDLPAMDDDELRRGKPTNHVVFGEDMAILSGDGLLTHAFELMARNARMRGVQPSAVADVIELVARGAGTLGMIGGQVADIQSDKGRWKKLSRSGAETLLTYIHLHKTAALLVASLQAGARLANASPTQMRALAQYGRVLGLSFQVTDDILDRVGDKKKLGKRGSDQANQKLTYPALFGLPRSQEIAQRLTADAHRALRPFGKRAAVLQDLADYVLSRDR